MSAPKKQKKQKELTAQSLRDELWETLLGVRDGKIDVKSANAIATTSREILRIVKTEIHVAELSGKTPSESVNGFLTQK